MMKGLLDSVKTKLGQCALAKELWDRLKYIYARQGTKENEARGNSDDKEVKKGEYFFFNYEEVGHLEIEFPYFNLEVMRNKKPNEIEDNPKIEKENNHEVEFNRQERKIEEEIIS